MLGIIIISIITKIFVFACSRDSNNTQIRLRVTRTETYHERQVEVDGINLCNIYSALQGHNEAEQYGGVGLDDSDMY